MHQTSSHLALAALCSAFLGWGSPVQAQAPAPVAIAVSPAQVQLTTRRDLQSIIVQATYADGITRDVTADAQYALAQPSFVKFEKHKLYPVADGKTELKVDFGGKSVTVPIEVAHATDERPISFKLDVMPVFMKAGCNTGSCHGAARGKDGFRLSLFGFDPDGDHFRLTREISGRRINLALPDESLFITKSAGLAPHTGGKRFEVGSELHQTLVRWLEAGAPADQGVVPTVLAVEIYPPSAVLDGEGAAQQLSVRAKYSDGTDRDVTSLAYFMTNNETSAAVSQQGLVTGGKRGEAFLMARFETHTVGTHFITLPKGLAYQAPQLPENNYIDRLVHDKLKKLRIVPSELCTDEEFLRRAHLDIVGELPTVEEHAKFTASMDPKKRELLVDELLGRKEFVEMWVMKWAELLQIRTNQQITKKSMLRYYEWLQERIAKNVPMDKLVQELLSANGGTFANAATNYYQNERDTLKTSENVAQVFMGMRTQCAQCHNHPFDRWTMDDYYSFAAFFAQIGRKQGEDPREIIVFNTGGGEVKHPLGGRNMVPKFLGGAVPDVAGKDRRTVMAQWLASSENPYFAKNLANIVWAHFFGQGIIDQVDDVRISNPPSNAELLDELGRKFTEYDYDFKRLVRDICTSRAYQLSTKTNETNALDERNFSHAQLRRVRAEILLDCITGATSTQNKFAGLPAGSRAVQIADGNTTTYFLSTFGRATRDSVCSCEVKMEPNLSQALHLLNGDSVNAKIQQGGVIDARLKAGKKPIEIIDELYVRCLTRRPTEKEIATLQELLAAEKDSKAALEDVFWSLLNSREFVFNH